MAPRNTNSITFCVNSMKEAIEAHLNDRVFRDGAQCEVLSFEAVDAQNGTPGFRVTFSPKDAEADDQGELNFTPPRNPMLRQG